MTPMTHDQIRNLSATRDTDILVARALGLPGIGYYAPPPDDPTGAHVNSVRHDTEAEAVTAWRAWWETHWSGHPRPKDPDATLCYWRDGHGPLALDEYTHDLCAAVALMGGYAHWGAWRNGETYRAFAAQPDGQPIGAGAATLPMAIVRTFLLMKGREA